MMPILLAYIPDQKDRKPDNNLDCQAHHSTSLVASASHNTSQFSDISDVTICQKIFLINFITKQHEMRFFDYSPNVTRATDNEAAGHMWPAGLGFFYCYQNNSGKQ